MTEPSRWLDNVIEGKGEHAGQQSIGIIDDDDDDNQQQGMGRGQRVRKKSVKQLQMEREMGAD